MAHHCTISTESGSGSPALPFHPTLADRGLLGVAVGAALPGPAIEATAPAKAQIATAESRPLDAAFRRVAPHPPRPATGLHSTLRAAWLRPKQTDLIPDKGQFR